MADVDATLPDWSITAASNKPTDATSVGSGVDDNLQTIQAVVRAYLAHYNSAAIPSAATTDLGANTGLQQDISGANAITSLGTVSAGIWKIVRFQGALTLTHSAALVLPGAANITTASGDAMLAHSRGSGNWTVAFYQPYNGGPPAMGKAINSYTQDTSPDWAADFLVSYDASAATQKKILLATIIPSGTVWSYAGTSAPAGWLLLQGGTMGDAASGGTARANADTVTLFTLLWNGMANAQAPVSGGRGANAAADYAAHKTITLVDLRGRSIIGTGTGPTAGEGDVAGTARTHGAKGGYETHTLIEAELAAHDHLLRGSVGAIGAQLTAANNTGIAGWSNGDLGFTAGGGVDLMQDSGSGDPHANMHPWLALNYIIKL